MATKRLGSFLFLLSLTIVLLALGACGSSEEPAPAASATGVGGVRIAFRHILPNTFAPIIVSGQSQ